MTPYYITGAFFMSGLLGFFIGRLTAHDDWETYDLPKNREARGLQPSDLK